jgi:hypothetical protein
MRTRAAAPEPSSLTKRLRPAASWVKAAAQEPEQASDLIMGGQKMLGPLSRMEPLHVLKPIVASLAESRTSAAPAQTSAMLRDETALKQLVGDGCRNAVDEFGSHLWIAMQNLDDALLRRCLAARRMLATLLGKLLAG